MEMKWTSFVTARTPRVNFLIGGAAFSVHNSQIV